jgi:pyridoxine 4-dehydrogenase
LSGSWSKDRSLAKEDFRNFLPRFQSTNLDQNLTAVEALREVASRKGVTVAQVAVAWVLGRGDDIVPLIGARRRDRLAEALGALELKLAPADVAAIEAAIPAGAIVGDRYDPHQMRILDSERG